MADDKRKETLREFLHLFFRGELPESLALLHDDVRFRIPGRAPLSGEFHGRDEVSRHIVQYRGFANDTGDVLKWEDWLVGPGHVAAVATAHMQHPGSLMTTRLVFIAAFSGDGRIKDFEVFFSDPRELERFAAGWGA